MARMAIVCIFRRSGTVISKKGMERLKYVHASSIGRIEGQVAMYRMPSSVQHRLQRLTSCVAALPPSQDILVRAHGMGSYHALQRRSVAAQDAS
jgi:hypothetical protein